MNTRLKEKQKASQHRAQPHKSQRCVLVAVRTAERRPVKASLTASNGEVVKNGAFDSIFNHRSPRHLLTFYIIHLKRLGHTHPKVSEMVK